MTGTASAASRAATPPRPDSLPPTGYQQQQQRITPPSTFPASSAGPVHHGTTTPYPLPEADGPADGFDRDTYLPTAVGPDGTTLTYPMPEGSAQPLAPPQQQAINISQLPLSPASAYPVAFPSALPPGVHLPKSFNLLEALSPMHGSSNLPAAGSPKDIPLPAFQLGTKGALPGGDRRQFGIFAQMFSQPEQAMAPTCSVSPGHFSPESNSGNQGILPGTRVPSLPPGLQPLQQTGTNADAEELGGRQAASTHGGGDCGGGRGQARAAAELRKPVTEHPSTSAAVSADALMMAQQQMLNKMVEIAESANRAAQAATQAADAAQWSEGFHSADGPKAGSVRGKRQQAEKEQRHEATAPLTAEILRRQHSRAHRSTSPTSPPEPQARQQPPKPALANREDANKDNASQSSNCHSFWRSRPALTSLNQTITVA